MAKRHITIPVSDEQAEMLAQMAAEQGESLASYVRSRIFARESLEAEFQALQSSLLAALTDWMRQAPGKAEDGAKTSLTDDTEAIGMLVEMLLHMRGLSNPSKVQAVRAEVVRLGYQPFGK
ncbi:hypothetical protein [Xanthomonas albilineans]|uniref:hypothetical protein n=1 Tax=Xanthomonas albilineans TaxID=29447 RepID=UPI0005F34DCC|nr:hypothetical protein [Xanthomonas albilineans]